MAHHGYVSAEQPSHVHDGYVHDGSSWIWLGDMEMDDTLLGLGAAGMFRKPPLAIGFLMNFAACAAKDKESGQVSLTLTYSEKLVCTKTFFGASYFAVLDQYERSKTTAEDLQTFQKLCGVADGLNDLSDVVARRCPKVLHVVFSGPLLDRGEQFFASLVEGVLKQSGKIIFWCYAGSFNLVNSSPRDFAALKNLFEGPYASQVELVETTLKPGAFLCDPPWPFWGTACPPAWSKEQAKSNPVGFDVSCDLQGANAFLEMSSPGEGAEKRGLPWLFRRIADDLAATGNSADESAVRHFLKELEYKSLVNDLTKMVDPSSSSLSKVREALTISQDELNEAYKKAADLMTGADRLAELNVAAKAYADLYKGEAGCFFEAGCTECFPPGRPCNGPRLDKRSILRSMAAGTLQGGPTADTLVVAALLLQIGRIDSSLAGSVKALPAATTALFHLQETTGGHRASTVCLTPAVTQMNAEVKKHLEPLLDEMLDAMARGASILFTRSDGETHAPWGHDHSRRAANM